MKALQRPARVAAVVSAIAAVGVGTLIAVGTASAAEPAKCVDNVNVREEPRMDAAVVVVCRTGTIVEAGEIRNGFVRLNDLGGWSAQEFISINGQKPVQPATPRGGSTLDEQDSGTTGTGRSGGTLDEEEGTTAAPRSSGRNADEGTTGGTRSGGAAEDEFEDERSGDRSESRTNGTADRAADREAGADEGAGDEEAAPAPAAPGLPGGILPGT
ncbi:MAG: hypothetical protein ACT4RN_00420 [Pseudonocardia sp.]